MKRHQKATEPRYLKPPIGCFVYIPALFFGFCSTFFYSESPLWVRVAAGVVGFSVYLILDRGRLARHRRAIRRAVEKIGGTDVTVEWEPLGPGSFGKEGHIYRVEYTDASGEPVCRYASTGFLAGIWWRDETSD